ncbi:hypothetical protein H8959_002463, partial [Pygathrix nigripes]
VLGDLSSNNSIADTLIALCWNRRYNIKYSSTSLNFLITFTVSLIVTIIPLLQNVPVPLGNNLRKTQVYE